MVWLQAAFSKQRQLVHVPLSLDGMSHPWTLSGGGLAARIPHGGEVLGERAIAAIATMEATVMNGTPQMPR